MHHLNLCHACACVSESNWQNRQLKTLTIAVITPQCQELVVKYQFSLNAYSFPKVAKRIVQTLMLKGLMHKAQANSFFWLQANHIVQQRATIYIYQQRRKHRKSEGSH